MRYALLLTLSFFLSGCITVISDQNRALVDPAIDYTDLKANPDNYLGKHVMLGGRIVAATSSSEISRMEIMQLPIDREGIPVDLRNSGGRFIAESTTFHDSALYPPTSLVTLVGEVKGKRSQPLDGAPYLYPVLTIKEIYVWDPDKFGGRRSAIPENPYANTYDQPMPVRPLAPHVNNP